MALGRTEDTSLIQALYTAASQPGDDGWRLFLDGLARTTRADCAVLLLRDGDLKNVTVSGEVGGFGLDTLTLPDDPAGLNRLRNERVYNRDDLPGMLPDSSTHIRIVRTVQADCHIWVMLLRQRDDFRAIDAVVLGGLVPHIQTGVGIWAQNACVSLDSSVNDRIAQSVGVCWIAFDKHARIVAQAAHSNHGGDRLTFPDPDTETQFTKAFRKTLVSQTPQALAIDPNRGTELILIPFQPSAQFAVHQQAIDVLGFVRDCFDRSISPAMLSQALDIALSEARLAVCLSQGLSLSEAAEHLGLTVETARNYSKQIYAKTGAKGQADLVRRVLNGVATFGNTHLSR